MSRWTPGCDWPDVARAELPLTLPTARLEQRAPLATVWRRTRVFLRSMGARFGALVVAAVALCAVAPGWLAPADPNAQELLARFTPPATRTTAGTLAA